MANEPKDKNTEAENDTDAGYDEAAHSGESRYGVSEGEGGVFGTTGGGSFGGGMSIVERPIPYKKPDDASSDEE